MVIFGRNPGGIECRWGRQISRFWANIWLHGQLSTLRRGWCAVLSTRRRRTVTSCDTTAGSKRRRLLFTGDVDEMFMTRSLNVTPKTTVQHLIVRSDKSVAYVTNNKRLRWTFCTIEAKLLTDTKHRAASLRQQSYLFWYTDRQVATVNGCSGPVGRVSDS